MMVGLADCNNFFVSCERSRNGALKGIPVVVLSNNDGCVVARSNEAKSMGIKMGQPAFEIRDHILSGKLTALSGNHLLYREISIKVHDIFRRHVPKTIDYSVDEAFLLVDEIPVYYLRSIGERIVREALESLDIPVTVGFAPSKTLAKLVTDECKHTGKSVGVLAEGDRETAEKLLHETPVRELWGVGRRQAAKLYTAGIYTAADFAARDLVWIRKQLGINGEKMWRELNGEHCIELNHVDRPLQDSISETRTFPMDVTDYDYLRARIAIYAADCAARLRKMQGVAGEITVFLSTNPFNQRFAGYHPSATHRFAEPVYDTVSIVTTANNLLNRIFNPEIPFKRGGVILGDIRPDRRLVSLFMTEEEVHRENVNRRLMKALDRLNPNVGRSCVKLASQMTSGHPGHNDGYSSSFQSPK